MHQGVAVVFLDGDAAGGQPLRHDTIHVFVFHDHAHIHTAAGGGQQGVADVFVAEVIDGEVDAVLVRYSMASSMACSAAALRSVKMTSMSASGVVSLIG